MLKKPCWHVDGSGLEPAAFFSALPSHFPDVTSLYVEGTSIAPTIEQCYRHHVEPGPYLPEVGTIWPPSKRLRCSFSKELCEELSRLSGLAAQPELGDHLHLYEGSKKILGWHDAFADDLWLSSEIPEQTAKAFAATLGRTYEQTLRHG